MLMAYGFIWFSMMSVELWAAGRRPAGSFRAGADDATPTGDDRDEGFAVAADGKLSHI